MWHLVTLSTAVFPFECVLGSTYVFAASGFVLSKDILFRNGTPICQEFESKEISAFQKSSRQQWSFNTTIIDFFQLDEEENCWTEVRRHLFWTINSLFLRHLKLWYKKMNITKICFNVFVGAPHQHSNGHGGHRRGPSQRPPPLPGPGIPPPSE